MRTPPSANGLVSGLRRGVGELPVVSLRAADGATADVYLHGAHVTSWRPAPDEEERLFLSARSEFRDGTAIRGGIPVIFPQFAVEGRLPRHGFARTTAWTFVSCDQLDGGDAATVLALTDSPATHAVWPAEFRATLAVRVGGTRLRVTLEVENTGASSFTFTCALHSYLRVHDVAQAEVVGLQGVPYRESGAPGVLRVDEDPAVRVTGALDRVYVNAPHTLLLREPARRLGIETVGFPDAVLWNPGAERAAALPDMEPDGAHAMLCVEAAAVQTPVRLASGGRWRGIQTLDTAVGA